MKTSIRWKYAHLVAVGVVTLAVIGLSAVSIKAQVTLTTGATVEVRSGPSPQSRLIETLPAGQPVILESPTGRRDFFRIRYNQNKTGWALGDYLLVPDLEELATPVADQPLRAAAPRARMFPCGAEVHYRWKQKATTAGFAAEPTALSVNAVLNFAAAPFRGRTVSSWCKERVDRERSSFSVAGFVRRTMTEDDGDVHVEITQGATDPVENCLVVEIPPPDLSPRFNRAKNELARLLSVDRITSKDFDNPVKVRFFGLAFWDGWHAGADLPSGHGRCNSTVGAAWELHPVYKVSAP